MTDEQLIEAMAKVMAENNVHYPQNWEKLSQSDKNLWISDARFCLSVARPIIIEQYCQEQKKELDSMKYAT